MMIQQNHRQLNEQACLVLLEQFLELGSHFVVVVQVLVVVRFRPFLLYFGHLVSPTKKEKNNNLLQVKRKKRKKVWVLKMC